MPFDVEKKEKASTHVNILNQKIEQSQWSSVQLEIFINRLNDRDNFEGIMLIYANLCKSIY